MTEKKKKITQKFRKETVRAIIDRCAIGAEFSPEDLKLFNEMCGTSWEGAKHMRNPEHPSDPRHVHVFNGSTWQVFSWRNAITAPSPYARAAKVMRGLAADMAKNYMEETSETECAYADRGGCNGPLQADHKGLSFDEIARGFIDEFGMPELVDGPPGAGQMFKDGNLEAGWIGYHAQRVVYQLLCRTHNASKGKRNE